MLIQPPGEPREQHLGDVRSNQKFCATQNFIKKNDRKIAKKLKMKSQERKKRRFWLIYLKHSKNLLIWVLLLQFELFCIFLKTAPEYMDPSGHFVFHEFFCSSNF